MIKISIIAVFALLYFTTVHAAVPVCPQRSGEHGEQNTGCPNLFKSQWTTMYWWQLEIEGQTYGRGQCYGALQCWPAFEQPYKESAGSSSSYDYSYWVHKVKEKNVYFPQYEEPYCDVYLIRTFRFPDTGQPGACPKPTPTPTPTPTPPVGENCTTAGWNGDCPPGTQPDGFGWCCAASGCGSLAPSKDLLAKNPFPNIANPSCCDDWQRLQCYQGGGEWYESQCACYSPVVIDVAGNGFNLTNAANGVMFDLPGAGIAEQLSWTSANSDDAWLALDRNGNGIVDNGKELFGTFTAQPALGPGESKNGFRALAMFDSSAFGGNADGQIDSRDAIFPNLRLWQDRNHNGFSEASELRGLSLSDIAVIQLGYKESRRKDANGNWFRYRAKVTDVNGAQAGRWAWDVFLQKP